MTTQAKTAAIETANLEGQALDWAVAIAVYGKVYVYPDGGLCPPEGTISLNEDNGTLWTNIGDFHHGDQWQPSADWHQAGELAETHIKRMGDCCEPVNGWDAIPEGKQCFAMAHNNEFATGPTKRIAVCRAVVLSKLGTSVEVPAVLVSQ